MMITAGYDSLCSENDEEDEEEKDEEDEKEAQNVLRESKTVFKVRLPSLS